MNKEKILQEMTLEEKEQFLTGGPMNSIEIERFGIKPVNFADGPHGVRIDQKYNCTHFPALCTLGSSWDIDLAEKMGSAIADDCIEHNIQMLLGPGINIKRYILNGRNFEYFSEDPVLSGEMAARYINGIQKKGVSACLKHFAVNNQEQYRFETNVEIDERTLREIYLKGFEIAIKKSNPDSVMCAYNKVNAVWCSENYHLLTEILKDEWNYKGIVISDWGAVHNISRAVNAGLDLQMPKNPDIVKQLNNGLENDLVTVDAIDKSVMRMLEFADRKSPEKNTYDRDKQHEICKEIASAGIVLLKNDNEVLPVNPEKYKKITVVGEYALSPLIAGQGSAEVNNLPEYIDSPFEEMKKLMPEIEFEYIEMYNKGKFSDNMLWPKSGEFCEKIKDSDLIIFFLGSMVSEDTEQLDRRSAYINPNFEIFIRDASLRGKKVVTVLQNGGALILGNIITGCDSIVEMLLGGEAAGSAIANVLCGNVNPSGKLSETYPSEMRNDIEYPGNGVFVEYSERFDVGYRYYDKHPEKILYPFGHGLSYTQFEYSDILVNNLEIEFTLKNTGKYDGAEVVQLYVGEQNPVVRRPIKELKKFKKIYLKKGESKKVKFTLTPEEISYYNVSLHKWVAENGSYDIYIGSSSRDIRLKTSFEYESKMPYTISVFSDGMIG